MKILVLGSTGMLGHVVSQYFFERQYEKRIFRYHCFKYEYSNFVFNYNSCKL